MINHTFVRIFTLLIGYMLIFKADAQVLKIATISPDGSAWMKLMREGANSVKTKTNGRVKIKFYPGGVMGSDKTVLRKIRVGQLQGAAMSSGGLLNLYPNSIVYNLPAKVTSLQQMHHVRRTVDDLLIQGLRKRGFVAFGIAGGGFAYIMSKKPIRSVNDLQHQKVWVPDNDPTTIDTVKVFGIQPIPLNIGDVLTGLQTDLINTVAISPIGAIVLQWHTQIKYMTDLPLFYVYAFLLVDEQAFNKISPADQKIVMSEMKKAFDNVDKKNTTDDKEAYAALEKLGIKIIKPRQEDIIEWQNLSGKYVNSLVSKGKLSDSLLQSFDKALSSYSSN